MPERETMERAKEDAREGKSPSTQAGEFVREEIHHVREGKHGARSPKQAIAIGLSKARRAGVKLQAPKGPASLRRKAQQDNKAGKKKSTAKKTSKSRSRAVSRALKRESTKTASRGALSGQAKRCAKGCEYQKSRLIQLFTICRNFNIHKGENMKLNSLQELYTEQLRDLYDAENQIIKALPEMIDAATSPDLKEALNEHLEITKTQATRLEQIFEGLGEKAKGETCKGMKGVIQEGSDLVDKIENDDTRDAGIITAAQRVEHYEMAGYGTARTFANLLGEDKAAQLLQQTLDEEKEADQKLTSLAEEINTSAEDSEGSEKTAPTGKRSAKATTRKRVA
jgi:ferritin-like metal-binding protein YciE